MSSKKEDELFSSLKARLRVHDGIVQLCHIPPYYACGAAEYGIIRTMKTNKILRAAFVAASIASACTLQAKQLKVLMIGNSFSICVLKEMPQCAASAGETLDLASLYIGGCPFDRHWENVEKAGDPDFKPYGFSYNYASVKDQKDAPVAKLGKHTNIPQALVADKWDVVTIQQASPKSPFYEQYQPYADNLIAKIRELAPKAEIVIQETWSYTPYSGFLKSHNMTPATMHAAIKESYGKLAAKHKLRIIPTGDAVQLYRDKLPVSYGNILSQKEIAALKQPETIDFHGDPAGNASWKKGRKGQKDADKIKLRIDASHLNSEGHYLQACTWLAALFGTDVTKLTYAPDALAPERAKLMRACAAEAVSAENAARTKR